jgi:hypothetical protein
MKSSDIILPKMIGHIRGGGFPWVDPNLAHLKCWLTGYLNGSIAAGEGPAIDFSGNNNAGVMSPNVTMSTANGFYFGPNYMTANTVRVIDNTSIQFVDEISAFVWINTPTIHRCQPFVKNDHGANKG